MSTVPPDNRPDRDWDAEFEEIASHLEPAKRTPESEGRRPAPLDAPQLRPAPGPRDYEAGPDDDDDDFVPAPPAPLPNDDPKTSIMIGALVVGPLWLVYLAVFAREARTLWWALAVLLCLVGFGLGIARQPKRRDDDDSDLGARL